MLSRGQYSPYTPNKKEVKKSDMDFITKDIEKPNLTKPVIIPSTMNIEGAIQPKPAAQVSVVQRQNQSMTGYNAQNPYNPSYNMNNAMNMNNVPQYDTSRVSVNSNIAGIQNMNPGLNQNSPMNQVTPQNVDTSSSMNQNIVTQSTVQSIEKQKHQVLSQKLHKLKEEGDLKK